jgi:hypothetical protein
MSEDADEVIDMDEESKTKAIEESDIDEVEDDDDGDDDSDIDEVEEPTIDE